MVVIRQVPGLVCITCGEKYPNEEITQSRFFITDMMSGLALRWISESTRLPVHIYE